MAARDDRQQLRPRCPRRAALACLAFLQALACAVPAHAAADAFPSRPVRIVVPYAPGGGVDLLARAIAERLTPKWGQPIVVDNKPGAATIIGAETVSRAAPDGHTLLLTSEATITSNPFLFKQLSYDPERDLLPVTQLVSLPQMVVAHASVPAASMAELVAMAKAKPNTLNYASYGSGSLPHLFFAALDKHSGIDIMEVPYKGIAPALAALVAGEVQLTLVGATLSQPHVQAGKLKPLAVAGARRLPAYPAVPTLAEAGLADADPGESWFGLFLPRGAPPALVQRIQSDVREAFADPEFRRRVVTDRGFEPVFSTPDAFARFIQADMTRKARLIKLSGAKAE